MKHVLFLLFLLINIKVLYAQPITVKRDAVLITKQNDTIKAGILVRINGSMYSRQLWVAGSYFESRILIAKIEGIGSSSLGKKRK